VPLADVCESVYGGDEAWTSGVAVDRFHMGSWAQRDPGSLLAGNYVKVDKSKAPGLVEHLRLDHIQTLTARRV
jgi:hypothetical protein